MEKNKNISESGQKAAAAWQKTKEVSGKVGHVMGIIGKVLYHMRKIFLAVPVVWAAVRMYGYAMDHLPETVGVLLQESGDYAYLLARETAAMGCMAVTALCLLLMFCSRRTIYPWIISIFSLVLPLLLIVTNVFPA